jgi:hypothetical protein
LISSGLAYEKEGKYQKAYEEFKEAYDIYEQYDDVSKMHKISRLIYRIVQCQGDQKLIKEWEDRLQKLETIVKERGLTFSQHEML